MKRLYNILFIFGFMATSCTLYEAEHGVTKTIQAFFPDVIESKVSITEKDDDTGLSLSWEQSDKLVVAGESVETYMLTAIDGKKATFSGNEVKGDVFDVILTNCDDYENRSYLSQTQTGVQTINHLEYDACLKGVSTYADIKFTQEWAEEHGGKLLQSGCLLLYFQLPVAATTVTQVKVETSSPVFYATNSDSSLKLSNLVMNVANGVVGIDNTVKVYLMTSMQEAVIESGTTLRVTVETDLGTYYKDIVPGKVSIMPGKRNVIKLNSKNWQPMFEYKNFTFMTYNVGKFEKSKDDLGHNSYPEAATIIREFDIDVVGLNEIENRPGNFQPYLLTSQIGENWKYYFVPAKNDYFGNAVVASSELIPITSTHVLLPQTLKDSNGEYYQQRSLGVVEYEDFIFCVTHLDHHSKYERAPQVKEINRWIKENYGNSDKPIILTGDMNATPGSQEIKGRPNNLDMEGLGDYWETMSVTKIDNVYVTTYPDPENPNKCIDYIFIWKNDNIEYTVNKSEVINACSGVVDVSLVSDHYPVYANVTFKKKYEVDELDSQI